MTRVRLEIDEVKIHRPKQRWKLYFVIVAEHPSDSEKMLVTILPQEEKPIKLTPRHGNSFHFDTDEIGSEGLFVLSRELPKNRELNVHIYLRHTRKAVRNFGNILKEVEKEMGKDAYGIKKNIAGIISKTADSWLVIAKKSVSLIGQILSKIPDRDFGFLSAFEHFGAEFEISGEIDRKKDFSGDASLVYSWSVDDV